MSDHTIQGLGATVVVDGETIELKQGDTIPKKVPADTRKALIEAETRDQPASDPAAPVDEPTVDLADLSDDELAKRVADTSVEDLVAQVGDDQELAARVLEAEQAGKSRSTLIAQLEPSGD